MKHNIGILFGIIAVLLLWGCTNSDEYIFNEADGMDISVEAFMTKSFDTSSERKKCDTINPGDSLIFLTEISPSKSIRKQKYYWTLDGKDFANEFSFKNTVKKPGHHQVIFFFVDFFNDTLSDTLNLYVSSPPILDVKNIIPANNTQKIVSNEFINFAWIASDPDSRWDLSYHFCLKDISNSDSDSSIILVDSILDKPHFTYTKKLNPLNKYQWTLYAINELKQVSSDTIVGNFFTASLVGEGGFMGNLAASSSELGLNYHLILRDESNKIVYDQTKESSGFGKASFLINALIPGKYTLYVSLDNYPDFNTDSIHVTIPANQVVQLDTIKLWDLEKTTIFSETKKDTLALVDTLKFFVKDGGCKITVPKVKVLLESNVIPDISMDGDTVIVPMESSKYTIEHSWTYRNLYVKAVDCSGNATTHVFYMRPGTTLPEAIGE